MKKIFFLTALCLIALPSLYAVGQSPMDRFFDKYGPDTSFTIINISPKMFNLFSRINLDTGDPEAQQVLSVAKKLTGLRIITKSTPRNGQLFREASSFLSPQYDELMTVRDKGNDLKFMVKEGANGNIHELIMLVGGGGQFLAMSLTGNIDLNEISKIAGNMNIEGFDKLKDVKKP